MVLQSTGAISLSHGKTEFGSSFSNLSSYYSVAAGVPTTGAISLSNLYSKAASTPSPSNVSTSNVSTSNASKSGTINLASLVTDIYGTPLTYATPSYNSSYFTSASLSSASLSYSIPLNKFANTSISVVVTNRFGKTATISIPFLITGTDISSSSLGSMSLTNNTGTVSLTSSFTDYSGTGLSYSVYSNPKGNASISSSTLSVSGNYRNTSYTVTVQATNSYGQSALASLSVTEAASVPAPTANSSMGSLTLYGTAMGLQNIIYANFQGTGLTYSFSYNPYGSASFDNATSPTCVFIQANNRATTYTVNVTATNAGGSATSTLTVTEILQVCGDINGTYTCYSNSGLATVIGSGTISINVSTGTGTINNGGGNQTITYTSYNAFSVPSWGVTATYNGVNQLTWSNGTVWRNPR